MGGSTTMAIETSSMRSGSHNDGPLPDRTPSSRSGSLPKPLGHAFQATTRRLQLKSVLAQLTLDRHTIMMAIKSSIPPTILLCAIQSNAWINLFQTQAYLAAIMSTCVLPTLPRARLIEYNFQLAFVVTVSYCWVLLGGWSGLQARKHTTNGPEELKAYNSSAEAIAAIFLMFWTWCVFTLKSTFPTWAIQCTWAGIFAVVTLPTVAQASSMQEIIAQTSTVFEVFLVGQAVGFVNALVVFPQSCRGVFRKDMRACLDGLVAIMQAQKRCIEDFRSRRISAEGEDERNNSVHQLQNALQLFINSIVKARGDVEYAEREMSWDRLDHQQLEHIASMLVDLIAPASGLGSAANMLQLAVDKEYNSSNDTGGVNSNAEAGHNAESEEYWHRLEGEMHEQSYRISEAIIEGVEHAKLRLELTKERSLFGRVHARKTDEESQKFPMKPGEASFLESYRDVFDKCCVLGQDTYGTDGEKLLDYYIRHRPQVEDLSQVTSEAHPNTLRYFLLLHSHTLLSLLGDEFLKLLLFTEECHAHPKRLLIPRLRHLRYWLKVLVHIAGTRPGSTYQSMDPQTNVELGSTFYDRKDPDHLPPANLMESFGDKIRKINAVFRTNHAAYGLRGVCAVMTISIMAFLRDSQSFYSRQRFLWALFAIVLSMGRTAGSSTFLLLCRILGTIASMIASYIIWYIVDQKTPGILVFVWLWFTVIGFFMIKFPKFFSVWFVALITAIVMIANELQVRQLGAEIVSKSGQAVYAPYIIFPYRLAIVALGVVVAYFWTLFPYPLSEHSELREEVAKSMYILANFSQSTQQTILARLHGTSGDLNDKTSPGFHLQTARRRIFRKYQTMSTSAKTYYSFLDWEFSLGGRFPKKTYGEILAILERVSSYLTLSGYVSLALERTPTWWAADQNDTAQAHLTPGGVTTRMIILHSALSRVHPLPPQMRELEIPNLNELLTRDVPTEEGFAAAALIHTVNWYLIRDVNRLTQLVRELVGELDFSFAVDTPTLVTVSTIDRTKKEG
ncbi:uncharacterized protein EURHEDRAFT_479275 [Aspergillus ruber CBS 135680]|uniref:Uncharacterized protein n=1 Tax=Aspergillus ruber (strain CBS 135680) TaxID=1388766 RepID=A0A017SEX6_ASPRC|nr:uncharacterized protein EURHEDRAFT_479275 [Aspergillus ruber CBS 135680]EYE94810.1 hypothetical protein EURHEDRAFT_479275 [Aspergillus ruber CBS 135680]